LGVDISPDDRALKGGIDDRFELVPMVEGIRHAVDMEI
jgi:hypothetical protein